MLSRLRGPTGSAGLWSEGRLCVSQIKVLWRAGEIPFTFSDSGSGSFFFPPLLLAAIGERMIVERLQWVKHFSFWWFVFHFRSNTHTHTLTRECVCVCVCLCSFRLIVFVDRMKTGPVWNIQTVFTETNENTAPNTVSLNELWFYTLLNSQCLLFPAVETYDVNMKWCDQPRPGTESQSSLTVTFVLSLFHCSLLRHWLSSNNGATFLSQRLNFLVFCFYPGIVESILQPVNCFFVCLSWWL